jgi:hypothetical protein
LEKLQLFCVCVCVCVCVWEREGGRFGLFWGGTTIVRLDWNVFFQKKWYQNQQLHTKEWTYIIHTVYYTHCIPPTCFGHSCGHLQVGELQRKATSKYYRSFAVLFLNFFFFFLCIGSKIYITFWCICPL